MSSNNSLFLAAKNSRVIAKISRLAEKFITILLVISKEEYKRTHMLTRNIQNKNAA
jgi:hypothetical protein